VAASIVGQRVGVYGIVGIQSLDVAFLGHHGWFV